MRMLLNEVPFIEALLICHANDSSTPRRKRILENAQSVLSNEVEKVILRKEIELLPSESEQEVSTLKSIKDGELRRLQLNLENRETPNNWRI
jgi:hypothetical protein